MRMMMANMVRMKKMKRMFTHICDEPREQVAEFASLVWNVDPTHEWVQAVRLRKLGSRLLPFSFNVLT